MKITVQNIWEGQRTRSGPPLNTALLVQEELISVRPDGRTRISLRFKRTVWIYTVKNHCKDYTMIVQQDCNKTTVKLH